MKECPQCFGRGDAWNEHNKTYSGLPAVRYLERCPTCNGKGCIDDEPIASETGPNRIVSVTPKKGKRRGA